MGTDDQAVSPSAGSSIMRRFVNAERLHEVPHNVRLETRPRVQVGDAGGDDDSNPGEMREQLID